MLLHVSTNLFFLLNGVIYKYATVYLLVYLCVDRHLDCFPLGLLQIRQVTINICLQVPCGPKFSFLLGKYQVSRVAGLCKCVFKLLRNCPNDRQVVTTS